jgi:hypothetical protein
MSSKSLKRSLKSIVWRKSKYLERVDSESDPEQCQKSDVFSNDKNESARVSYEVQQRSPQILLGHQVKACHEIWELPANI